jgi:hypothetical protein
MVLDESGLVARRKRGLVGARYDADHLATRAEVIMFGGVGAQGQPVKLVQRWECGTSPVNCLRDLRHGYAPARTSGALGESRGFRGLPCTATMALLSRRIARSPAWLCERTAWYEQGHFLGCCCRRW